ncbi:MAG: permease [Proteobacteria bacterium]|nr:permease [Pseudomonadota bacterium]
MLMEFLNQCWQVLLELSPALLAGLLLAGLLHIFLPSGFIHRNLNKPGPGSVIKAALIGVPMPLCSCGVIPTGLGLHRDGASKGATTAFLISTPQTGVDSVFVSAAFLGWPFALFKLAAAFVTGVIGGLLTDRVTAADEVVATAPLSEENPKRNLIEVIRYAFFDLFAAIDRWILIGVVVAALITILAPDNFFANLGWAQGFTGMLLMLVFAIPLYVCTTGSVPIAASFIAAGMPAGTALVFLMAGPATNVATIGAIYRTLGAKVLSVYLGTVVIMSIAFGMGFEFVLSETTVIEQHQHGAGWLAISSALLVLALMVYLSLQRVWQKWFVTKEVLDMKLKVEGMSCQHCIGSVKKALEQFDTVELATPDLASGEVEIKGENLDREAMVKAVVEAGFSVSD